MFKTFVFLLSGHASYVDIFAVWLVFLAFIQVFFIHVKFMLYELNSRSIADGCLITVLKALLMQYSLKWGNIIVQEKKEVVMFLL